MRGRRRLGRRVKQDKERVERKTVRLGGSRPYVIHQQREQRQNLGTKRKSVK